VLVGIHRITLRSGVAAEDFERFMAGEVFPNAAVTPGSVARGGASCIRSQHLLRADGAYLWLVKDSGVFDDQGFSRVFARMLAEARGRLEPLGMPDSSTIFTVLGSFDTGPRNALGGPIGDPIRGSDL
jgi:hypothetical protein